MFSKLIHLIVDLAKAFIGLFKKPGVPPQPAPPEPSSALDQWLAANPKIRDAIVWEAPGGKTAVVVSYKDWSAQQKADLQAAYDLAAKGGPFTNVVDPLPNEVQPPFNDYPLTILSPTDAWGLYLSLIAQSLMTEIGKKVSWSMVTLGAKSLALLLDSRSLFKWRHPVYVKDGDKNTLISDYPVNPWTLPAHGNIAMEFLNKEGLIDTDRIKTIDKLLTWLGHNTYHSSGGANTATAMQHWQYRGLSPVSRVIEGTISEVDVEKKKKHWIRGCAGVEGFLHHVLRVVNIPATAVGACDHAQPFFPTEKKYLAHGDDVHILKSHPELSGLDLLISETQYDQWFGPQVSEADKCKNISNTVKKFG